MLSVSVFLCVFHSLSRCPLDVTFLCHFDDGSCSCQQVCNRGWLHAPVLLAAMVRGVPAELLGSWRIGWGGTRYSRIFAIAILKYNFKKIMGIWYRTLDLWSYKKKVIKPTLLPNAMSRLSKTTRCPYISQPSLYTIVPKALIYGQPECQSIRGRLAEWDGRASVFIVFAQVSAFSWCVHEVWHVYCSHLPSQLGP